jgi:TonB family protein
MKLSCTALVAIAFAAGVTPAAFAQASGSTAAVAPALASGVQPVAHVDVRYPYREARSLSEGRCTVVFDVTSSGETTNVRTQECSSRDFEREAQRVAANLHYPAETLPAGGVSDQTFTIRWQGEEG